MDRPTAAELEDFLSDSEFSKMMDKVSPPMVPGILQNKRKRKLLEELLDSASEEPARPVLKRLIVAVTGGRASREHWLPRCDASSPAWCFINLAHVR